MRKKILSLLTLLLLASCGAEQKDYYIIKYDLNYETSQSIYLNQVVMANQTISKPEEPNRRDYVFEGWYLDKDCTKSFTNFDEKIKEDLTLYASWSDYEDLEDYEKIDRFIEKVNKLSGNVSNTEVIQEGLVSYVSFGQTFPIYSKVDYNRYKDITTVDYYDEENNKYGEQQYLYDETHFYNIYKDLENNGRDNEKKVAKLDEDKIDNLISIDFMTLFGGIFSALSNQLKNGHNFDEIDYTLGFNYTHLDEKELSYSFEFDYYTYVENVDFGAVEEIYMMEFGLSFVNGKIKRSKVEQEYIYGIQGEVQTLEDYTIEATYLTTDGYSDFTGTRFNPSDF